MDVNFVRDRITQLRLKKGVSEYKMGYDLGHSRGYINNISSGRTLPSMAEFFAICVYFGITPVDFFSEGVTDPGFHNRILSVVQNLNESDQQLVLGLAHRLAEE